MNKMTKDELEAVYNKVDPWSYQTNPADIERKRVILEVLNQYGPFERALDLCCGEGWITKDIPAKKIFGTEISGKARERWPNNIQEKLPQSPCDLVMITGALYENYHWDKFVRIINGVSSKYVLTCHIATREYWAAIESIEGELIQVHHFPYHRSDEEQFTQRLRVYKK